MSASLTCAFCGAECYNITNLRKHIEQCEKHPMFALRKVFDTVLEKLQDAERRLDRLRKGLPEVEEKTSPCPLTQKP